ncbi:hypothetical protein EDC01DRAFT_782575 [Geopyxis carbonaria]|nr:hypothetical protein EDC01DRAFT_782575 [Geopyxis carbonaria]
MGLKSLFSKRNRHGRPPAVPRAPRPQPPPEHAEGKKTVTTTVKEFFSKPSEFFSKPQEFISWPSWLPQRRSLAQDKAAFVARHGEAALRQWLEGEDANPFTDPQDVPGVPAYIVPPEAHNVSSKPEEIFEPITRRAHRDIFCCSRCRTLYMHPELARRHIAGFGCARFGARVLIMDPTTHLWLEMEGAERQWVVFREKEVVDKANQVEVEEVEVESSAGEESEKSEKSDEVEVVAKEFV